MSWLQRQVSLYKCVADNRGRASTFEDIFFTQFAMDHKWYYCDSSDSKKWVNGIGNDLYEMIRIRTTEMSKEEMVLTKYKIQCFTPAALLKTKKQGRIEEVHRTGILQFDFDYESIKDYDIDELMLAVFDLPFIGYCGKSISGKGFFALALIAEPDRLMEYAEHCFKIFESYGVPVDTSKGRNVQDLRFVSYDANMMIRENPKPLRIKRFYAEQSNKRIRVDKTYHRDYAANSKLLNKEIQELAAVQVGQRWATVQRVAYTLGGIGNDNYLSEIKQAINNNSAFNGEEPKYIQCAEDCFGAGKQKPLPRT